MGFNQVRLSQAKAREPFRILIVGAGIGGLALGRALRQRGLSAEIVERAPVSDHAGAGLYLPANGVRVLKMLGLYESARGRGCVIARQRVLNHRGRVLMDIGQDEIWGATGPCLAFPRSALHEVLLEGANAIPIRRGVTVESVSDDGAVVRVRLSDGTTGDYDLLVGADGIHSSVRTLVFDAALPRFVGQLSWRMVVEGGPAITSWTVLLGRGRAFLLLPVGDGRLYCYADVDAPAGQDPTDGDVQRFIELFGDFEGPVPGALGCLSPARLPYFSPIEEVRQRPWAKGLVVLIGDAAHAMSPNMAEGASMAMEDALVLAEEVASGRPLPACLAAFEARRARRVRWVQAQTHRRDRTRNLPPAIRDRVLRTLGKRIFKTNYRPLLGEP